MDKDEKKTKCPHCGSPLESVWHKSIEFNVPDAQRGRGLCPHCGEGCAAFDVNIYHNELEKARYPQTDEEKYGLCCACGRRADGRVWWEPPAKGERGERPSASGSKGREVDEILDDATPEELLQAAAVLGRPLPPDLAEKVREKAGERYDELFSEEDLIFSYSRKEAIEDGVLVDVSHLARQEGFVYPVAVTKTLFEKYIRPDSTAADAGETVMGRLHDILTVLRISAKRVEHKDPALIYFTVRFSVHGHPRVVRLKSVCGPGDTMEPVITIMFPDED